MSRGPFRANVINITHVDGYHELTVKLESTGADEVILVSDEADIEAISNIGDCVVYYLAEPDNIDNDKKSNNIAVVIYKEFYSVSSVESLPILKSWYWIRKGNKILNIDKLPKVIDILLGLSCFYGKRKELVEKALTVLELTQDEHTLDALFSMPPLTLYELLNDNVCLDNYETICSIDEEIRCSIIIDTIIPLQIADLLVNLKLSGADFEKPTKHDLAQTLALAVIHGENPYKIQNFICSYDCNE